MSEPSEPTSLPCKSPVYQTNLASVTISGKARTRGLWGQGKHEPDAQQLPDLSSIIVMKNMACCLCNIPILSMNCNWWGHRHQIIYISRHIKYYTFYLIIHKVLIAAILELFKTVTSVKLFCDPLRLPIDHSTSRLTTD